MKLKDLYKKKTLVDYIIYASVLVGGILFDQLTKWLTVKNMALHEHIPVIKTGEIVWASFLHIRNDGAAFGMMDDPDQRWIFLAISTIATLLFMAYLYLGHAENMLYGVSIAMVISGGIGNMIDRLGFGFYVNPKTEMGEVIDFIDFRGIWDAIFNGADSFVCVGAGMLILALVIDLVKEYKAEAEAKKNAECKMQNEELGTEEPEQTAEGGEAEE